MSKPKIALITTGGTISTLDSRQGTVPKAGGAQLLSVLGDAASGIEAEVVEFARIPGCEMTPEKMAELALVVERELARDEIAGAVVTHGTDTIEETAFVCHLTVTSDKPVVFTGSMRTGSELSWDGPRNLLDALKVASWPRLAGHGTVLVMNEEIHSARFVTKGNGLLLGAFYSPACGPLGRIYNGTPMLFTTPATARRRLAPRIEPAVALVRALSGDTQSLGEALTRRGLRGLVIEAFGSGRVPPGWCEALEAAVQTGMPVVLASRTGGGAIGDPYGYRGASYLRKAGLIAAHEMPGHKARLKLMLALGNGLETGAIRDIFENEGTR
jgi:L-asparaginase